MRSCPPFQHNKYPTLHLTYEGSPETARSARESLRDALGRWGVPFTIHAEDLLMAVHEAISNAWRHGSKQTPGRPIKLIANCTPIPASNGSGSGYKITVTVSDTGDGFDLSKQLRVEMLDSQGRELHACGRFLMSKGCDSVTYDRQDGWFTCILEKTLDIHG